MRSPSPLATQSHGEAAHWLVFQLQSRCYALAVHDVVEVLRIAALTPLPEAPVWLAGLLNLRGQVIPVLDVGRRLGLPPQLVNLSTPIIIAHAAGRQVGLLADAVLEVLALSPEAISSPDALAGSSHAVSAIARPIGDQRSLVLLLDLHRLIGGMEAV
ncbi:MAG: purine-binding chemotaxis protein CheW [Chloroflexi bacterium]|nr:purine-binding chemotaxis protein CheW [Chloroflexota bacterium]